MRSLTFKTLAITAVLAAVPLAGAQAKSGALDQEDMSARTFHGPRLTALTDQIAGIRQGIADARQGKEIDAAQAGRLDMRTDHIERTAERVASADHGRIPSQDYRHLLHRLDNVNLRLLDDTGGGFNIGDGSDGGVYPNG